MMHRIRYAISHPNFTGMLKGTVEIDETYVGGKTRGKGSSKLGNKTCVVSLVERGGRAKSICRFTLPSSTTDIISEKVQTASARLLQLNALRENGSHLSH